MVPDALHCPVTRPCPVTGPSSRGWSFNESLHEKKAKARPGGGLLGKGGGGLPLGRRVKAGSLCGGPRPLLGVPSPQSVSNSWEEGQGDSC